LSVFVSPGKCWVNLADWLFLSVFSETVSPALVIGIESSEMVTHGDCRRIRKKTVAAIFKILS
jgi:hypothetical protein